MAADTPYHRLPEDNRPSMESVPGDDQRLIDPDPLYDDDSPPPKKGIYKLKLSYHPTFYIRLVALCLFISSFGVFVSSHRSNMIPVIVFLSFAIVRNIIVLYAHLVRRCFIRIHIEIGRQTSASNSKPKKWRSNGPSQRFIQIIIDWILIVVLIITSVTARVNERYWNRWDWDRTTAPCILVWIGIPLYALSTFDMGTPGRIRFVNGVSYDTAKNEEKENVDNTVLPTSYRDVESSGALQGDMTRKTGADSPPML